MEHRIQPKTSSTHCTCRTDASRRWFPHRQWQQSGGDRRDVPRRTSENSGLRFPAGIASIGFAEWTVPRGVRRESELMQHRVPLTPDRGMRQNVCRTWSLLLFCYPRGREHRIQASSATITYRIIGEEGHEELVDRVRAFD